MNKNVIVSVIIPVFNTSAYLRGCLDSVLSNDYRQIEVICINDGSADGSLSVLSDFARQDDRVRILDLPHGGVSKARNAGLDAACGEYIVFIDSDDWIHPQYIGTLLSIAQKEDCTIVIGGWREVEGKPSFSSFDCGSLSCKTYRMKELLDIQKMKYNIWGRIFRRDLIGKTRFSENLALAEDKAFMTEIICEHSEEKAVAVDRELYYYFQRQDSAYHRRKFEDEYYIIDWYLEKCRSAKDNAVRALYLKEAFRYSLSFRYYVRLRKEKALKRSAALRIKGCLKVNKRYHPLGFKQSAYCVLSAKIPAFYRLIKIMAHPSALKEEKNIKAQRDKTD